MQTLPRERTTTLTKVSDDCSLPFRTQLSMHIRLSFSYFPYLVSAHAVFILSVLRPCASSLCIPFSFVSFCITSLLSFVLPIFRCPLTFSLLHLPLCFSPRVLTISFSNFHTNVSRTCEVFSSHSLLFSVSI